MAMLGGRWRRLAVSQYSCECGLDKSNPTGGPLRIITLRILEVGLTPFVSNFWTFWVSASRLRPPTKTIIFFIFIAKWFSLFFGNSWAKIIRKVLLISPEIMHSAKRVLSKNENANCKPGAKFLGIRNTNRSRRSAVIWWRKATNCNCQNTCP